jgi:S-adenosyl-L-methionine hydrolase (adenosine-forming)
VVDPGVGGPRKPIAVRTARHWFVGPDNGLLSLALRNEKVRQVRILTESRLFLDPVSRTFQGRDIFAPVAARLASGLRPDRLGPPCTTGLVELAWPEPTSIRGLMRGQVIHIDHFGNAVTNLSAVLAERLIQLGRPVRVGRRTIRVGGSYESVPPGRPIAVPGSTGYLEIAVNGGSAARRLGITRGQPVSVRV